MLKPELAAELACIYSEVLTCSLVTSLLLLLLLKTYDKAFLHLYNDCIFTFVWTALWHLDEFFCFAMPRWLEACFSE